MLYNNLGLKYFIYNTTKNNIYYLELPMELRRLIWIYAHNYNIITCYICDKILINFEINVWKNLQTEHFSIINSISKCCYC